MTASTNTAVKRLPSLCLCVGAQSGADQAGSHTKTGRVDGPVDEPLSKIPNTPNALNVRREQFAVTPRL